MPKLPRVQASEVIRALERLGFVRIRQRGSHVILKKQLDFGVTMEKLNVAFEANSHATA